MMSKFWLNRCSATPGSVSQHLRLYWNRNWVNFIDNSTQKKLAEHVDIEGGSFFLGFGNRTNESKRYTSYTEARILTLDQVCEQQRPRWFGTQKRTFSDSLASSSGWTTRQRNERSAAEALWNQRHSMPYNDVWNPRTKSTTVVEIG